MQRMGQRIQIVSIQRIKSRATLTCCCTNKQFQSNTSTAELPAPVVAGHGSAHSDRLNPAHLKQSHTNLRCTIRLSQTNISTAELPAPVVAVHGPAQTCCRHPQRALRRVPPAITCVRKSEVAWWEWGGMGRVSAITCVRKSEVTRGERGGVRKSECYHVCEEEWGGVRRVMRCDKVEVVWGRVSAITCVRKSEVAR